MGLGSEEVAHLVLLGVPVVCLDTCSILDVMRDPARDSAREHEATAALQLLDQLENGPGLIALLADQVRLEFADHAQSIQDETSRALDKLRERIARVSHITATFGVAANIDPKHLDGHAERARAVVDRWIAATTATPQGTEIPSRALLRLNSARTPARKGKDSMKDCVVIETYLEAVHQLRNSGLTAKVVFASSNTKDYAMEPTSNLRTDLAAEFSLLGIEYAPNLAAAKHMLGL